ncbi:MAG TPA: ABC transporter permease [Thermoleophilaceae bacterium]|nr:ABC transporter permease [Thermoleophilaceae bacterium]
MSERPGASALTGALARLRVRRGRGLLAALGIVAAAAMLGAAVTVGYGLATGFERTAERADLPDVLARFDEERPGRLDERVRALPNLEAVSLRLEVRGVPIGAGSRYTKDGVAHVVREGRRGYAVVEGRDLRTRGDEVVVESGLAREWGLSVGDRLEVAGLDGGVRVVGIAVSPDNVAYPLAAGPRFYLSNEGLLARYGDPAGAGFGEPPVNSVLLWTRDPDRLEETLTQARAVSYGITDLRFITRSGVQVLIDQAAGIVVALLVAFSLVALISAVLMLAASARADVERRLSTIGVMRAVGFSRRGVAARHAGEAVLVALPAATIGLALGWLVAAGPSADLLGAINQLGPGVALLPLLGACLAGIVAVVCAATAWPAWRAAGRAPAETLRGPELRGRGPEGRGRLSLRLPAPRGAFGLGVRIVAARRVRLTATATVLAVATAVVLLMLALAALLERLAEDPGTLGKRYELTADASTTSAREVRALPGVEAVAPRYAVEATDSFRLGENLEVIAFPGDHTRFEAPPLAEGRRLRSSGEAEIGLGLAQALGTGVGGTLATQLPSGEETRFRVVGVVRSLEKDGRVAYTRPRRLLAADSSIEPELAVRLEPGVDRAAVERRLAAAGAPPTVTGGATTSNRSFLALLATLLRAVAAVNGLVCLYALVQSLSLTAIERRGTVATLRACGAGHAHVVLVLAGAAAVVVALAAPAGWALERFALAPVVAGLAADYAELPLGAGGGELAVVGLGIVIVAGAATALVARRAAREPIVRGLREG